MLKHTYLGINGNMCCILKSSYSFEALVHKKPEVIDFCIESTNWMGCDSIMRTLSIKGYRVLGSRIQLEKPLVFEGADDDCGHEYPWSFRVYEIWEVSRAEAPIEEKQEPLNKQLADDYKRLLDIATRMHTWIFLHTEDEFDVYKELGLTAAENAMLGSIGGPLHFGSKEYGDCYDEKRLNK